MKESTLVWATEHKNWAQENPGIVERAIEHRDPAEHSCELLIALMGYEAVSTHEVEASNLTFLIWLSGLRIGIELAGKSQ